MVLSMLVAIIAAPGLLGSQEAIRQSQSKEKREEHRARRCNLIATCVKSSNRSREINGRPIILRNGKLWIDTCTDDGSPLGHLYAGYYLPYPDSNHEGLVTTITDVAPIMNWVYIDKDTHEAKYGVRVDAQPNLTGPFDCTRQDRRLTFDGWEGWCAVEEAPGLWGLYFDVGDDGLRSKVVPGKRVLEVELSRKEKRFQKEATARQHDQTTKRTVNAQEDAPVDQPLAAEALVSKPGVVDEVPKTQEEAAKPRPFRIPKSIFENPPPVLESSTFDRPSTPPPAYSTSEQSAFVAAFVPIAPVVESKVTERTNTETEQLPRSTDQADPAIQLARPVSPLQVKPSVTSKTPPNRSTSPPTSRSNPPSEKRTTPKLNRSSGTRALAQAQMFEAMAVAQKPKIDVRASTRRTSRANSNADSGSEYSRDSLELSVEVDNFSTAQPALSPTPAPLALGNSKAILLRRAETRDGQRSTTNESATERPKTPPRQRALTDPTDPAIFGVGLEKRAGNQEPTRRPSRLNAALTSRPSTSRSSSQASNQSPRAPLQRRGTTADRAGSPRAPLQQRGAVTSSPRAPPQQASRSSSRGSLASTMTSGRGNRGMTSRTSGSADRGIPGRSATLQSPSVQGNRPPVVSRKTTSALFREIDELVSQDVQSKP